MRALAGLWVGIVAGVLIGFAVVVTQEVQAADPQPVAPLTVSDNCEQTATVGLLEIYYCEMDYGPDLLVNSFGFMVVEN